MIEPSIEALTTEIWNALQSSSPEGLRTAEQLCLRLPASTSETAERFLHLLITTAFELEKAGQYENAERLYQRILDDPHADAPNRANAAFRCGLTFLFRGDHTRGKECLSLAASTEGVPELQATATLHLVQLLAGAHQYESALEALSRVTALEVSNPSTRWMLWFNVVFCRARLREPDLEDARLTSGLPADANEVDAGVANAWMQAAFALEEAGAFGACRDFYKALLRVPELPPQMRINAHFRLGLVLDRLFDFEGAAAAFQAAIDCDDDFPAARAEARHRLANLYYALDEYDRALPCFAELRSTSDLPAYYRADAQLKYANCLLHIGNIQEAEAELERCQTAEFEGGADIQVKSAILLVDLFERRRDHERLVQTLTNIVNHPSADAMTKAGALTKLQQARRRR